jgi:hypothetical protein
LISVERVVSRIASLHASEAPLRVQSVSGAGFRVKSP